MTTEEILALTAISSVITAVVALFSSITAWRAVNISKKTLKEIQEKETHSYITNIAKEYQEVVRTTSLIQNLITNLLSLNRELALFAGQPGGSRQKLLEKEIENDKKTIKDILLIINNSFSSENELYQLETEDLNKMSLQISMQFTEVNSIRDKLEGKLVEFSEQVKLFRENAIAK